MAQRYTWKFMETDTTTFLSDEAEDLKCDACNDTSLYHDSWAYFNSDTARVLCEQCHAKEKPEHYTKVLTYHLSRIMYNLDGIPKLL